MTKELDHAKKTALRLLSYRPRTEAEIVTRLKQKGFSPGTVNEIIEYLKDLKYVDDRSFARQWLRYRLEKKKKSKRFIYLELRNKGIEDVIAAEVLESISGKEEYEMAVELARQRTQKGYAWPSTARYLAGQGFPSDIIGRVYEELITESTTAEQP